MCRIGWLRGLLCNFSPTSSCICGTATSATTTTATTATSSSLSLLLGISIVLGLTSGFFGIFRGLSFSGRLGSSLFLIFRYNGTPRWPGRFLKEKVRELDFREAKYLYYGGLFVAIVTSASSLVIITSLF